MWYKYGDGLWTLKKVYKSHRKYECSVLNQVIYSVFGEGNLQDL